MLTQNLDQQSDHPVESHKASIGNRMAPGSLLWQSPAEGPGLC